jgi:hypothetical protein
MLEKEVFLKNTAISLILLAFLALLSLSATGSLVTGTSGVFNKVQGEVFQETSSEVTLQDNKLFISSRWLQIKFTLEECTQGNQRNRSDNSHW